MFEVFRRVTLPHFSEHGTRSFLTAFGIALGVAALIGLRLAYQPIEQSFQNAAEKLAGDSAIRVSNGDLGVPEDLLNELKQVPGVDDATALIEAVLPLINHGNEQVYLFGADFLAERKVRQYDFRDSTAKLADPLIFLAQADSIALTGEFARTLGVKVGDVIDVKTASGSAQLKLRATLDVRRGPATLFGGRIAVMDIFAAQKLVRMGKRFSAIDVVPARGQDLASLEKAVKAVVGGRGTVTPPGASLQSEERLLRAEEMNSTTEALGALVVGLYIIFNTMAISVAQRWREIGLLRSLGMTRGGVTKLIMAEAAMFGVAGSLMGVPLGLLFAKIVSVPLVARLSGAMVTAEQHGVTFSSGPILLGAALGIIVPLLAALVPIRRATLIKPIEVLRNSRAASNPARAITTSAAVGFLLMAGALGLCAAQVGSSVNQLAGTIYAISILFGTSLLVPFMIRGLIVLLSRIFGNRLGGLSFVAMKNLTSRMVRIALTATVLVMTLSYVTEVWTAYSSLLLSFSRWFDSAFPPADLLVSAGGNLLNETQVPVPDSMIDSISKISGVASVGGTRTVKISFAGLLPKLNAFDVGLNGHRLGLAQGNPVAAAAALREGRGIVIDESFANKFHVRTGDLLQLPARVPVKLPIVGIAFNSYNQLELGTITVDRQAYRQLWGDNNVDFIEVVSREGVDRSTLISSIEQLSNQGVRLFAMPLAEFRNEQQQKIKNDLAEIPPIVAIAVLIAMLGLADSLFASILDRTRELGVLRAVGATRKQVLFGILAEAAFVGVAGGLIAALAGSLDAYYAVVLQTSALFQSNLLYREPLAAIAVTIGVATIAAILSAYFPARNGSRVEIRAALASD